MQYLTTVPRAHPVILAPIQKGKNQTLTTVKEPHFWENKTDLIKDKHLHPRHLPKPTTLIIRTRGRRPPSLRWRGISLMNLLLTSLANLRSMKYFFLDSKKTLSQCCTKYRTSKNHRENPPVGLPFANKGSGFYTLLTSGVQTMAIHVLFRRSKNVETHCIHTIIYFSCHKPV